MFSKQIREDLPLIDNQRNDKNKDFPIKKEHFIMQNLLYQNENSYPYYQKKYIPENFIEKFEDKGKINNFRSYRIVYMDPLNIPKIKKKRRLFENFFKISPYIR